MLNFDEEKRRHVGGPRGGEPLMGEPVVKRVYPREAANVKRPGLPLSHMPINAIMRCRSPVAGRRACIEPSEERSNEGAEGRGGEGRGARRGRHRLGVTLITGHSSYYPIHFRRMKGGRKFVAEAVQMLVPGATRTLGFMHLLCRRACVFSWAVNVGTGKLIIL